MNTITLVKRSKNKRGGNRKREVYIFLYDDESIDATLNLLGRFADDSELNFNWRDANLLARMIKIGLETNPLFGNQNSIST